ncbi:TPA: recombinase family protein [Bacillus cereus]|nr:recombinase family protein [Bacillus cereus]
MSEQIVRIKDVLQKEARVAFYARYSTSKQDYAMQLSEVQRFLQSYPCKLTYSYIDDATSAVKLSMEKREKLQSLIEGARRKQFDVIVVYKGDRIARSTVEHQQFRKLMNELEIPVIISSTREIYTSGGIVQLAVSDGLTKMEYEYIKERTSDTLKSKQKRGEWAGGKAPYGYRYIVEDKTFQRIEMEWNTVQCIFKWFKRGYSITKIVNELKSQKNEENESLERWNKEKVKGILTNPFYAGYIATYRFEEGKLTDRSKWILAPNTSIEPVLTKEEWEYIMQLYEEKKQRPHNPKRYNTPFLLRDILYCQHCHQLMKTKNKSRKKNGKIHGGRWYYCDSAGCDYKLSMEKIHEELEQSIFPSLLERADEKTRNAVGKQLQDEISWLEEQMKVIDRQNNKLLSALSKVESKISREYDRYESIEDNMPLLEPLVHYQFKKKKELTAIKQKSSEYQHQLAQKKQALLHVDKLECELTKEDMEDVYKARMLLLQLLPALYIDKCGVLDAEVHKDMN